MTEVLKMVNQLEKLQATCIAMKRLFDCECSSCSPNLEAGDALHKTVCAPAGLAQLHEAGGPCAGFATNFCAQPLSQSSFCSTGTWSPSMGSEEWMKNGHEVMDMGDDNGAGLHEAENQAPAYAEKIADALHQYLTAGAMQKESDARLESMLSGEIASLRHLHENMGFLSFLPFKVPFFESVDKQDEKVLEEDHALQKENFGEELSPSQAWDYGVQVGEVEKKLSDEGVELPGKLETELNELQDSAKHYNGPTDSESWLDGINPFSK